MRRVPPPPGGLMVRIIPDRMNRYLWCLTFVLLLAVAVAGPIISSIVFAAIYQTSFLSTTLWLWGTNAAAFAVALPLGAAVLSRIKRSLTGSGAILFAVSVSLCAVLIRMGIIRLTDNGPLPPVRVWFFAVQLALALMVIASITSAVMYATSRERAVIDAFTQLDRAQANLAHEEESVRADVFDQLHGSLQAEFVAVRRNLANLAETTTDPEAARIAAEADAHLDRIYREGVGAVARALRPVGLEAGIVGALDELQARIGKAAELIVTADPVVDVMDDPMTGGLHQDVRMAAFRVIEEAVSNAMRHANATSINVTLSSDLTNGEPTLVLRVDNPASCRTTIAPGAGLSRMRARSQALGGRVDILQHSGMFSVIARLPLVRPDNGRLVTA